MPLFASVARSRAATLLLALGVGLAIHAGAAVASDQDEREIAAYTLTMDKVRSHAAASIALHQLGEPEEAEDEEGYDDEAYGEDEYSEDEEYEEEEEDDSGSKSLDEIVAEFEARPGAKAIIASHGFSTREFAVATMALFQAGLVVALSPDASAPLPPGVNPKNVALVRANRSEVDRLYKATRE